MKVKKLNPYSQIHISQAVTKKIIQQEQLKFKHDELKAFRIERFKKKIVQG